MKKLTVIAALLFAASMVPARAADEAQKNWDHHCAMCHGKNGKGETRMGRRFKVRDLTNPKVQATFKDEKAIKDIKDGVTVKGRKVMPGFSSKLSDEAIKDIVVYLRKLPKK